MTISYILQLGFCLGDWKFWGEQYHLLNASVSRTTPIPVPNRTRGLNYGQCINKN